MGPLETINSDEIRQMHRDQEHQNISEGRKNQAEARKALEAEKRLAREKIETIDVY